MIVVNSERHAQLLAKNKLPAGEGAMPMFQVTVRAANGSKVVNYANGVAVSVGSAGWARHFIHNGHGCILTIEAEDCAKAMQVLLGCMTKKWQSRCNGGVPEELNIEWA